MKVMSCISVTKNPSERRNGIDRFRALLADFAGVRRLSAELAEYMTSKRKVSIHAILQIFEASTCKVFDGAVNYKNVRAARIFASLAQKELCDSAEDWTALSGMSKHVSAALKRKGVSVYETAKKFSQALGEELDYDKYNLNDFVIYTCLLAGIVCDD